MHSTCNTLKGSIEIYLIGVIIGKDVWLVFQTSRVRALAQMGMLVTFDVTEIRKVIKLCIKIERKAFQNF